MYQNPQPYPYRRHARPLNVASMTTEGQIIAQQTTTRQDKTRYSTTRIRRPPSFYWDLSNPLQTDDLIIRHDNSILPSQEKHSFRKDGEKEIGEKKQKQETPQKWLSFVHDENQARITNSTCTRRPFCKKRKRTCTWQSRPEPSGRQNEQTFFPISWNKSNRRNGHVRVFGNCEFFFVALRNWIALLCNAHDGE